jgi:hypothetical protein
VKDARAAGSRAGSGFSYPESGIWDIVEIGWAVRWRRCGVRQQRFGIAASTASGSCRGWVEALWGWSSMSGGAGDSELVFLAIEARATGLRRSELAPARVSWDQLATLTIWRWRRSYAAAEVVGD